MKERTGCEGNEEVRGLCSKASVAVEEVAGDDTFKSALLERRECYDTRKVQ